VVLRVALIVCLALGFFGLGFEASHGPHALYQHWYCMTPFVVIGIAVLLGVLDVRRSHVA
jgi:hypothetical protein